MWKLRWQRHQGFHLCPVLTPLTFLLKKSINFTFISVGKVIMSNTSRQSYTDKDKTEICVANEALFITAKQETHCKVERGIKSSDKYNEWGFFVFVWFWSGSQNMSDVIYLHVSKVGIPYHTLLTSVWHHHFHTCKHCHVIVSGWKSTRSEFPL